MDDFIFSNELLQKKQYQNHNVDEIMTELSKFGDPELFKIRRSKYKITYVARISTMMMYSANQNTARGAAEELREYIHDVLSGACGIKRN